MSSLHSKTAGNLPVVTSVCTTKTTTSGPADAIYSLVYLYNSCVKTLFISYLLHSKLKCDLKYSYYEILFVCAIMIAKKLYINRMMKGVEGRKEVA